MCDAPRLLGRLLGERDFLHVVALLNLIDRVHPFNHSAKDGVLTIESRLRLEADIELAAARRARRIDFVTLPRGREAAAQMLLLDLSGHCVSRSAGSSTVRISALNHEIRHDAMPRQAVVEAFVHESLEIRHGLGRCFGVQLEDDDAAFGLDSCVVPCISHWKSIRCALASRGEHEDRHDGKTRHSKGVKFHYYPTRIRTTSQRSMQVSLTVLYGSIRGVANPQVMNRPLAPIP